MSGSRSLSLRARMLVMLVGVTTVLLLVMGTVSTYLLARRVDGQIAQLNAGLTEHLQSLQGSCGAASSNPCRTAVQLQADGYAVAAVPLSAPVGAVPITTGTLTSRLVSAIDARLQETGFTTISQFLQRDQTGPATRALQTEGCAPDGTPGPTGTKFPYLSCQPFDVGLQIQAASKLVQSRIAPPQVQARRGAVILVVGQPISTAPNQVRDFIIAELITGAALIALLGVGGEWLIGRGLDPLDQMTATANEITDRGDLTARMPDADEQSEVGRLGSAINTMLDRIQQAFSMRLNSEQKVREFAADASHELRTPLTTIRGYAELYRQGALGPDQLPSAMRRIEQEAHRMSTLVAELLELARLDRTSSLDLTETDLASVVRDAVADAVAVEPQRPVRAEAPPRLVAVVDEPRLRQVLANLLGNVRTHTPVATPVAVRLGAITGGVLIEVADAGPGMSSDDAIRAFDRFHRGADRKADCWEPASPDYSQNGGGSGLGLSIVQAIASAHGGRATLESRPGKGTKVRVWLPVRVVA